MRPVILHTLIAEAGFFHPKPPVIPKIDLHNGKGKIPLDRIIASSPVGGKAGSLISALERIEADQVHVLVSVPAEDLREDGRPSYVPLRRQLLVCRKNLIVLGVLEIRMGTLAIERGDLLFGDEDFRAKELGTLGAKRRVCLVSDEETGEVPPTFITAPQPPESRDNAKVWARELVESGVFDYSD